MELAAAGAAAAQIGAAQRTQQISIAALRSSQLQAQSIATVLSNSAASGKSAPAAAQPAAPVTGGGGGGDTGGGSSSSNAAQARGSLLNILV